MNSVFFQNIRVERYTLKTLKSSNKTLLDCITNFINIFQNSVYETDLIMTEKLKNEYKIAHQHKRFHELQKIEKDVRI